MSVLVTVTDMLKHVRQVYMKFRKCAPSVQKTMMTMMTMFPSHFFQVKPSLNKLIDGIIFVCKFYKLNGEYWIYLFERFHWYGRLQTQSEYDLN